MGQHDDLHSLEDIVEFDQAYVLVANTQKGLVKTGNRESKKSNIVVMTASTLLNKSLRAERRVKAYYALR